MSAEPCVNAKSAAVEVKANPDDPNSSTEVVAVTFVISGMDFDAVQRVSDAVEEAVLIGIRAMGKEADCETNFEL